MEEVDKGCPMIRMGEWVNVFFWYRLTRVVPDKRPLNGCVCVDLLTYFINQKWEENSLVAMNISL